MCNCKQKDCFKTHEVPCNDGCEVVVPSGCVMHGIDPNSEAFKLPNIGVTKSTTLARILKLIDDKLSKLLTSDFSLYDMNGLNVEKRIHNIKDFVFEITKKIKEIEEANGLVEDHLEEIDTTLSQIEEKLLDLENIGLSSSKLNINNTDDISTALTKMLSYVENISSEQVEFENSNSILFERVVGSNKFKAHAVISKEPGNSLTLMDDGIYTTHRSTSAILQSIVDNPQVLNKFNELVVDATPAFTFELMSTDNILIKYINILGDTVNKTVQANVLLKLVDVKRIITPPTSTLTITFKGVS